MSAPLAMARLAAGMAKFVRMEAGDSELGRGLGQHCPLEGWERITNPSLADEHQIGS